MVQDAKLGLHGEPELIFSDNDVPRSSTSGNDIGLKGMRHTKVTEDIDGVGPAPAYNEDDEASGDKDDTLHHPANQDDVLTHTIHVDDDTSLQALTFRSFFLGMGLSCFGGALSGIYYFKPQTVTISTVFVAVIAFLLGEAWSLGIPRTGRIGRFLNPFPFNIKEHLFVTIMGSSAGISSLGIEVLAVQRLYYGAKLSAGVGIFMLFSSQFMGYGLAGLMRRSLVYPKCMLWPYDLPVNSMLENLHQRRPENRKPLKVFLIVFACIFCWEIIPEWIFPLLTGFSIFCLANQNSTAFTYVFGGASGNEGLGLFSLCFDWQYISGGASPLYFPMGSLISMAIGISGCIILYTAAYFGNIWNAKSFPFLSQTLFPGNTTPPVFDQWDQNFVIGANNHINKTALDIIGLPNFATSNALYNLTTNMSTSGGIVYLFLWYPNEMLIAFSFLDVRRWSLGGFLSIPSKVMGAFRNSNEPDPDQPHYDPHYKLILAYKPCPDWVYGLIFLGSVIVALVLIYVADTTLPWWGLGISLLVAYFFTVIFAGMQGVTGVNWLIQAVVQMIGGYIMPGDPVSNMWFSLYGYNAVVQGVYMSQDLKLAQYGHLAPRCTLLAQMLGTTIGAILNYVLANEIITNQFDILKSVEGTNIWSGQQAQTFNSNAITFGGLAHEMYSIGGKYQWMTLIILPGFLLPVPTYLLHKRYPNFGWDLINVPIIVQYLGWLSVGINSSLTMFFVCGFGAQIWLRRKHPNIFVRYNYLVSAALDGGTAVIIFILSFAIFGAAGAAVNFPVWWGNNSNGNYDRCKYADGESA